MDSRRDSKLRPLLAAAEQIRNRLEVVLSDSGLSLPKFAVLHHLDQAGEPLALTRLAEQCSCVKSNITQLVDRLEADRLVERTADPVDRRSILASLTDEGRSQLESAWRLLSAEERRILRPFRKEEIDQLLSLLERFDTR